MWVKVDDRFPDHKKVFAAGEHLGPYATGRVIAIWVEAMCWTNKPENATNGFIPIGVMRTFKHDRQPVKVAEAMSQTVPYADGTVHSGLLEKRPDGYQIHDYGIYNDREKFEQTSAARAAAGRRGGLKSGEARREAKLKQTSKQLLHENEASSKQTGSKSGTPFPGTRDLQVQEHRDADVAGCAETVEKANPPNGLSLFDRRAMAQTSFAELLSGQKHEKLCALVGAEFDAGHIASDSGEDFEHLKDVAARAKFPDVTSTMLRKALDCVLAARGLKVGC